MSTFTYTVLGVFFSICLFLYIFFTPPRNFPKTIPTIPFYYSLIPLFKDCDQLELYREYLKAPLERYGAVKLFFGGRWNILVQRPAFMAEIFRFEDDFAKSGNQTKIPHSVLAEYTGNNIISSHGADWRKYQRIFKPALQSDLEEGPIYRKARTLVSLLLQEQSQSGSVTVHPFLQRHALANIAESFLGTDLQTLARPDAPIQRWQVALKPLVFNPIALNFPFLDRFPIPARQRARDMVKRFTDELCDTVRSFHQHSHEKMPSNGLACRLINAVDEGTLTEQEFRHNINIILLAGHENPMLLMNSLMFVLGEHQDWQQRAREEILALNADEPEYADLKQLPILTSIIYETLRIYPPISQLINRHTTEDVMLGDSIHIPANAYVGYNGHSTNLDPLFWGKDAEEFRPDRWGGSIEEINTTFRHATTKGAFISFHGGRRTCLGQKFGMFGGRISLAVMLKQMSWKVDPTWPRRMTPAGPLSARMLRVQLEKT